MDSLQKKHTGMLRAWGLLILGAAYLVLVMGMFAFGIDLASDKPVQYALHITVILSAVAYLLFADAIYAREEDKRNARPALIFAALFAVPVLIGRCIGITVISTDAIFASDSIFNFYAAASVVRPIEMVSWTVLFPLSMVFLSRLFFGKRHGTLGWLCAISAVCCFIAFATFFTDNLLFLFIGVAGWGFLFLAVIIAWIAVTAKQIKTTSAL